MLLSRFEGSSATFVLNNSHDLARDRRKSAANDFCSRKVFMESLEGFLVC